MVTMYEINDYVKMCREGWVDESIGMGYYAHSSDDVSKIALPPMLAKNNQVDWTYPYIVWVEKGSNE